MADRGDTHYSVSKLNLWFAVSSLALLVALVWMVIDDWNRPWKEYQRQFRQLEIERVEQAARALEEQGVLAREAELLAQQEAAQAALQARADEIAAAEEAQRLARGDMWKAQEDAKKAKSEFNWVRFQVEEERKHGDPAAGAKKLEAALDHMNELAGAQEVAEARFAAAQARVEELKAVEAEARAALAAETRELAQVRARLQELAPEDPAARIANVIRDAPGLDFIGPSLKVNKVVLEDLTFDLNFTRKQRIDMCHTCHLGIDRPGFEEEAQPFATHPRLDLYLSSRSPHPMKDFGCTICHRGSGEALDFIRADHRPDSAAEAAEWAEEHHWHKQHHWDYPMLTSGMIEASCVQCHKTSMELIADDAPTVSTGYRLVEQYGCYACHKIDWFPTKRRPGPSLTNLQAKLTPEFVSAWIEEPKGFRPTTWMPQFFHLENYAPQEEVVVSRYGAGRPILGEEWDDAAVAAVSSFLFDRAPLQPLPPVPVEGDAHRGREVMRVSGCLSCHNMAPFGEEEPETRDLALERRGTNEHGPNLRGVATKLNREWLFWWLKDPAAYWAETRMPDLRLSDQEAADIAAYMLEDPDGIFRDVPEGWEPQVVDMPPAQMHEVLAEQARWYFSRDGRAQVEARLEGRDPRARWDDLEQLKVAVGEKIVTTYGCYSCHEIEGLQDMMPIGTELSNWGSKTVDKLDFGMGAHFFGLDGNYREGWLEQKIHAPRSYDRQKVKNPTEKLRMPWFGFEEREVRAIATFVVGLVDDEVQRARMVPAPHELAMDTGMRVVRQKNCIACHQIDPGTVTFEAEDGRVHTVTAELLPVGDEPVPPAHDLAKLKAELEYWESDEVGIRVLRPEPELAMGVGERLFVPVDKVLELGAPNGGDFVRLVTDYYFHGMEVFDPQAESEDDAYAYLTASTDGDLAVEDVDGVLRDHSGEPYDKIRWTYAPPVLWDEGGKLQPRWFHDFLGDVRPIRPQLRVRMPSFHYEAGEAAAVADYFAHKSVLEWPVEYTRRLRLEKQLSVEQLAEAARIPPEEVAGIEAGFAPAVQASFERVLAFGSAQGFVLEEPVDPAYETTDLRSHAYLARRAEELPGHLQIGERIVTDAVNCYQCHFRLGQPPAADPIAWAPDLAEAHARLREEWTRPWLADPGDVYPGTAMPANFQGDPPQYQEFYPGSTNAEQLRVVLEWLFNFDRVVLGGSAAQ